VRWPSFTYDSTGTLSFVGATAPNDQGERGPCWTDVSPRTGSSSTTGDTPGSAPSASTRCQPVILCHSVCSGGPQTPPGRRPALRESIRFTKSPWTPAAANVYAITNTMPTVLSWEGKSLHILACFPRWHPSEPNAHRPPCLHVLEPPTRRASQCHRRRKTAVSRKQNPERRSPRFPLRTPGAFHSNSALQERSMGECSRICSTRNTTLASLGYFRACLRET